MLGRARRRPRSCRSRRIRAGGPGNFNQDRGGARARASARTARTLTAVRRSATGCTWSTAVFRQLRAASPSPSCSAARRAQRRHLAEHSRQRRRDEGEDGRERALTERSYRVAARAGGRAVARARNELPHHVDGTGSWVVLFSLLTRRLLRRPQDGCIESATRSSSTPALPVVHGCPSTRSTAGRCQPLVGMRIIDDKRMSVQARMS